MASKKKAAKAGAGAAAAAKAVRSNQYVQRVMDDPELRDNLRNAFESARKAYGRMQNGKGPVKAVTEDKKTQKELKEAANSLKEAADQLRGNKKKKSRKGRSSCLPIVGAGVALVASEGLRKKVLDALFGKEEEFEYTASTTPEPSTERTGGIHLHLTRQGRPMGALFVCSCPRQPYTALVALALNLVVPALLTLVLGDSGRADELDETRPAGIRRARGDARAGAHRRARASDLIAVGWPAR